jgi:hypothetical protein
MQNAKDLLRNIALGVYALFRFPHGLPLRNKTPEMVLTIATFL